MRESIAHQYADESYCRVPIKENEISTYSISCGTDDEYRNVDIDELLHDRTFDDVESSDAQVWLDGLTCFPNLRRSDCNTARQPPDLCGPQQSHADISRNSNENEIESVPRSYSGAMSREDESK